LIVSAIVQASTRTRSALLEAILAHVVEIADARPGRTRSEGTGKSGGGAEGRGIDLGGIASLLDVAARMLRDDAVGLHFAAGFDFGALGPFAYAVLRAPTLGTALRNMERYSDVLGTGVRLRIEHAPPTASVVFPIWGPGGADAHRHIDEAAVVFLLRMLRRLAGPGWSPREVSFRHAAPEEVGVHRRLIGVPFQFDQPESAIRFASGDLDRPVRDADRLTLPIVERHLDDVVSGDGSLDPWRHEVELAVASQVCDGHPSIRTIAHRLGVSTRTLQRRLGERGLRYRDLVSGVRMRIASHYLAESDLSLGEIGFLLGYSELSAFDRAFRRWTGTSPGELRRSGRHALAKLAGRA
jgi:AraC-like DNA-binding protein